MAWDNNAERKEHTRESADKHGTLKEQNRVKGEYI